VDAPQNPKKCVTARVAGKRRFTRRLRNDNVGGATMGLIVIGGLFAGRPRRPWTVHWGGASPPIRRMPGQKSGAGRPNYFRMALYKKIIIKYKKLRAHVILRRMFGN
jgi:hypothetical protein